MKTLSTGQPSTLGVWRDLCAGVFGDESEATRWLDRKIEKQGRDEEVIADEGQLLQVLGALHLKGGGEL